MVELCVAMAELCSTVAGVLLKPYTGTLKNRCC